MCRFFPEVPPEIPPYTKQGPSVGKPESKSEAIRLAPVDPCVSRPESKPGSQVLEEKKERKGEEEEGGSVAVAASSSGGSSSRISKKFRGGRAAGAISKGADVSQYLSGSVVAWGSNSSVSSRQTVSRNTHSSRSRSSGSSSPTPVSPTHEKQGVSLSSVR